ncbi:tumor necrosis factor receptor superfamily member 5-like [Mya arenaria]|uniref:tumor necrosis factor receptor superfamily member 5-like n=1 Tax=Mya arenaria TaxID=6604 RepID=UPI0022DF976F|nr:tumor necrosis factor receptor superfamily member 5-like [Mya arenaria]XP_052800919.1 tumor necrosis factor receptor superfamily member 5-like [Mya arenaria]
MESVILVVVLAVFTPGISAQFNDSYYLIEVNRETIQCKMCPPGAYWIQHCSKDGGQAICMDCPYDRFSEDYNRALYCKRCTKCKGNDKESGEVVAEACTRFHDTKCECKLGYWREERIVGYCREVSPCKPSYGVKKMANSHNDTTCERCVNGKTFSNISSEVTPCQNCSVCPEGWVQKLSCHETEDTVCIPKDEEEDVKVGLYVGVTVCILAISVIIIVIFICRKKTTMENIRRRDKHDGEEQANPSQRCPVDSPLMYS